MGNKNGRLSVCSCGHSTLVSYYLIASKFHIWITFIKLLPKSEYGLCPITKMVTEMGTTYQNAVVDTLSHLSHNFLQISYMDYFYQTIIHVRIWICPMNDNQDCLKIVAETDISFSLQGIMRGPLSESDCFSSFLALPLMKYTFFFYFTE